MAIVGSYREGVIRSNEKVGENVYKLVVEGAFDGVPGQFYMLKAWGIQPLLARPLSICDLDEESITFLYLVVGTGTRILSKLHAGDRLTLLGPLGTGFSYEGVETAAVVTGGIGIAPMLYLLKHLPGKVDLYAGFRDESYFLEELKPYVNDVYLASDSGNVGICGTVCDVFEDRGYDAVFSCGPNPMFASLKKLVDPKKLQISMEAHMACGIGACLGCTVDTLDGMTRVCTDGPVFLAEEVNFDA
ncbi:MAG: dihydroorotate dehydrogenase electron transfer subunit [Tissierellia bacterium]|nr:dihydroorotate dehydrogenase electron transfer subunit [Tissierellia bacterium]